MFTGAGGGLLGTHLLGWTPIGYVEWNEYCQKVIRQRIEDGILSRAPIFGDVRAFASEGYAAAYQGMVDVITAGFPCQPFSVAGKGEAENDERNMWPITLDVIRAVRPSFVYLENVPGLLAKPYIRTIFGDLAKLGFNARWGVLGGSDVGNISDGQRLWIVAYAPDCPMLESLDIQKPNFTGTEESCRRQFVRAIGAMLSQDDYTKLKRDPDEVARGMEQLKAIGNGQIPAVVRTAFELLTETN